MGAPDTSSRNTRAIGNIGQRRALRASILIAACCLPQLAHASPGCTALNGTFGPSFANTGNDRGTGFDAGDVITLNLVVVGGGTARLYDATLFTDLIASQSTVGTWTYTVPADTNHELRVSGNAGPSTERTWSCTPAPTPTPAPNNDSSTLRSLQKSATRQSSQAASAAIGSMVSAAISSATVSASAVQPAQPSTGVLPAGASGLGMG